MSLFHLYRLSLWVIFTYVLSVSPFSKVYARSTASYENPFGPNTEFIVEEGSFETDSMYSNKKHTSSKEHVIVRRGATSLYPCSNLSNREKMLSVPQHCPGTGDLPIPNECRIFLHCITKGVAPILGCCPQGYHFDHKFLHCIPEARALCTDEDLAHARDVIVDYPDSTSDSDDYQEASSNSQEPSFDPRSWSPDNLESSPDTSQKQQWQYYPAPDNLFPQAFWSRNPYTGHMWPARFGYAIPISVSYSSIPIRIKRHKKDHGGTHGGNNFKENSTSSSSTLTPPSPSPPTSSTKKPKPPPPPPTSTSTTTTTTSTTTPKPKPKPTTTHVTTTQKPKPSSSSTTTKKSEGGSDEGFQQVGSNEIDSAEEAMATMATSSKPSSNSFSGNSNEGSDEGFMKVTSSENQNSSKLNGNKLYAKPGSRKGNPPPIIGFPAEPRKFHEDDDDDSKEKKRHANLKPKKRQQAAKPQSVAIINPKPTNEKYESVKSEGGGWKPEFGGESEEDPIGGGIIPLPGINDNGSLRRKRKRQAIYYSSEEDRDQEEATQKPKKKRRNRRNIGV